MRRCLRFIPVIPAIAVSPVIAVGMIYCLLCLPWTAMATFQEPAPAPAPEPDREELMRQFERTMTGARLVGQFNIVGTDGTSAPRQDFYMVSDLSRGEGDTWIFTSTMKFGETEMVFPVPTEVKWAGDTPMITLTNHTIPDLGTFTARVLIYRDHYAGTWQHGPVRGHMWGTIERAPEASAKAGPSQSETNVP